MLIDVYDFDGTIYDGDSTVDFTLWCLRRHPSLLLALPRFAWVCARLALGRVGLREMKNVLFSEMAKRFSLEEEARRFWGSPKTRENLGAWFQSTPRDVPIVIASASPEFELRYAAELLGVETLIGTRCDPATGLLAGPNCKGEEKLRRIEEAVGPYTIRAMYTDSVKSDGPLLRAAQEGYILRRGSVSRYEGQ